MNQEIQQEIAKCISTLRGGGFVFFISETGWTIGCDAQICDLVSILNTSGELIYPSLMIQDAGRLQKYIRNIPESAGDMIEYTEKPLHLLFEEAVNYPCMDSPARGAFRIVKDPFTTAMLKGFGKPVYSAIISDQTHIKKADTYRNNPCYVVNLRAAARYHPDYLVVISYAADGSFKLIKK
jgi:L-threonylcarbamoyladenylate synthase